MPALKPLAALALAASCLLPTLSHAQGSPTQPPRWSIGLGAASSTGLYAGESSDVTPLPIVVFEGEQLYWRAVSGGYRLVQRPGFGVDATLGLRLDKLDPKDLDRAALARRGINRDLLSEREFGLDLGARVAWSGGWGEFELSGKTDIAGRSDGQEFGAEYSYPFQWGPTQLTAKLGVNRWSARLADYRFGTLDEEVARGLPRYRPGAVTVPYVGVSLLRPFADRWVLLGEARVRSLPDAIRNSPLADADLSREDFFFIGVARGF